MEMKIKNTSIRYGINRPRSGYGHKYNKYKRFFSMMKQLCIKQYPSNISGPIQEKVLQHRGCVEKKRL